MAWEALSDRYLNELFCGCQSQQLSGTTLGDPVQLVSSGTVLPLPVILQVGRSDVYIARIGLNLELWKKRKYR